MSTPVEITSLFIQGAPPGELAEVVKDIKALTSDDDPGLIAKLKPAFEKYCEEQLLAVKLPNASDYVLISPYNKLSPLTYYDTASSTSFTLDPTTQTASSPQSYTHSTAHSDLIASLSKSLSSHFSEHYPPSSSSSYTVCATPSDDQVAILLSTTKSSPKNFLSGRWRSTFLYSPTSSTLSGSLKVNVHYYEDGNVALQTAKTLPEENVSGDAASIVRKIAAVEKAYQEEVNRSFVAMNENAFKGLRRQLPVTRQRVEWEKIRGYSLGSDLHGKR